MGNPSANIPAVVCKSKNTSMTMVRHFSLIDVSVKLTQKQLQLHKLNVYFIKKNNKNNLERLWPELTKLLKAR
jgi:hypothetical protein